jgi:hypothetical protein
VWIKFTITVRTSNPTKSQQLDKLLLSSPVPHFHLSVSSWGQRDPCKSCYEICKRNKNDKSIREFKSSLINNKELTCDVSKLMTITDLLRRPIILSVLWFGSKKKKRDSKWQENAFRGWQKYEKRQVITSSRWVNTHMTIWPTGQIFPLSVVRLHTCKD